MILQVISIYTPFLQLIFGVIDDHMLAKLDLIALVSTANRAYSCFGDDVFTFVNMGFLCDLIRNDVQMDYFVPLLFPHWLETYVAPTSILTEYLRYVSPILHVEPENVFVSSL